MDDIWGEHEYGIGFSVADENRLVKSGITTLVLGPRGSNSHSPQEWVDIKSVENLTKIYKSIGEKFGDYLKNKNG